jgi:hypothetical protein
MTWGISQRFGKDEEMTLIIKGCLQFRKELKGEPSHLPFPQNSCCYNFKAKDEDQKNISLPLNLLYHLWDTAEGWRGACAECGAESVYGIGCGGMLSSGGVMGHCIVCHSRNYFHIGGLTRTGADLKSKILGDTYKISKTAFGSCYRGEKVPIYERLHSLGCLELPKKSWLQEEKPDDATAEETQLI